MANGNSERTYHKTSGPYLLPNDAAEKDRLELQARGIAQMMHGKVNHAPLLNPTRILEVGCGTGNTTQYFTENYPDAQEVIGIDLSPVPPRQSKATFIQGDFCKLAADPSAQQLRSESFDLVFSRLLVYGIPDWPGYIAQAASILRPGGWLELQEIDLTEWFDDDEQGISESWTWLKEQQAGWMKRGLDMACGPKLEGYLRDAGFVDVHVKSFRWPYGPWKGHPETDLISSINTSTLLDVNFTAIQKVLGPEKTLQELEQIKADMTRDMAPEEGKHNRFWVVYGRKP